MSQSDQILNQLIERNVNWDSLNKTNSILNDWKVNILKKIENAEPINFLGLGDIIFPYINLGKLDTKDLFVDHELNSFAFYVANRNNYKNFIDIGANIGIHSLIASKIGYNVFSFEPDASTFKILNNTLKGISNVKTKCNAITGLGGKREFVRVNENITASGISGTGKEFYGNVEKSIVDTIAASEIILSDSLIKIDAEGCEVEILESFLNCKIDTCDYYIEITIPENREKILNLANQSNANIFSEKIGWRKASSIDDLPSTWRDGSIFISVKNKMIWK